MEKRRGGGRKGVGKKKGVGRELMGAVGEKGGRGGKIWLG